MIPLPPDAEQAAIVEAVNEKLSQIDGLEAEVRRGLARAARLRQAILKAAFEGKLVPQDPADERRERAPGPDRHSCATHRQWWHATKAIGHDRDKGSRMNRLIGKTIQIYCPSGDPRGVRIAEITTSVPQAILAPRTKLDEAINRQEIGRVGIYFLFGPTDDGADEQVYIGEADDCTNGSSSTRSRQTNGSGKSPSPSCASKATLTKGHGRLLEHWAIQEATNADRYFINNGTVPAKPPIPEAMEAECGEVFEVAGTLLSTLGYPVFEPLVTSAIHSANTIEKQTFTCVGKGYSGAMRVWGRTGYVVLEGSMARREGLADSVKVSISAKRASLVQREVLEETTEGFRFRKNHAFRSPHAAANLIENES